MVTIWKWLSGKKSAIAATLSNVLIWAVLKGKIDEDAAFLLASTLTVWTGIAVGHSAAKWGKK